MFEVHMFERQKVTLSVSPKDRDGDPAPVDGAPSWSYVEGDGVVFLVPSEDGLSCDVLGQNIVGTATVECTADVNLGEEVSTVTELVHFNISQSPATVLGITATTPENLPDVE